jgi:hypothetical protein
MHSELLKRPSAFIPLAMSIAALSIVLGYAAMFGTARQVDEGTAAHLWQLLMAGQIPVIAFFVFKWFRSQPKQASLVVALHRGLFRWMLRHRILNCLSILS